VRDAQHDGFERALTLGLELQSTFLSRLGFAEHVASLRRRLEAKTNV
jgi:hypothetical protein